MLTYLHVRLNRRFKTGFVTFFPCHHIVMPAYWPVDSMLDKLTTGLTFCVKLKLKGQGSRSDAKLIGR